MIIYKLCKKLVIICNIVNGEDFYEKYIQLKNIKIKNDITIYCRCHYNYSEFLSGMIVRYKMDGNTVPVEDLASVNTYLLINIVTTMIIFLLLNLYNRVWSYASLYEALLV